MTFGCFSVEKLFVYYSPDGADILAWFTEQDKGESRTKWVLK
jgi:hypothetical protein